MSNKKWLKKVENNQLSPIEAYDKMYMKAKPRRAHFCKLKIKINNESLKLNRFLGFLFLLPAPIVIVKIGLRFVKQSIEGVDLKEVSKFISYAKGTSVSVQTADEEVFVNIKVY